MPVTWQDINIYFGSTQSSLSDFVLHCLISCKCLLDKYINDITTISTRTHLSSLKHKLTSCYLQYFEANFASTAVLKSFSINALLSMMCSWIFVLWRTVFCLTWQIVTCTVAAVCQKKGLLYTKCIFRRVLAVKSSSQSRSSTNQWDPGTEALPDWVPATVLNLFLLVCKLKHQS